MTNEGGFQVTNCIVNFQQVEFESNQKAKDQVKLFHQQVGFSQEEILDCSQACELSNEKGGKKGKSKKQKSKKESPKDMACRFFYKILSFLLKKKASNIPKFQKGKTPDISTLHQLFQKKQLRHLMAQYFITGQYKNDISLMRKRLKGKEESSTSLQRNLLQFANFIEFSFIQGHLNNFLSLKRPVQSQIFQESEKKQCDNQTIELGELGEWGMFQKQFEPSLLLSEEYQDYEV